MPFVTTINSLGTFATTITQGEATFTLNQVSAPATFTASIASLGPQGPAATIDIGTVTTVGPEDPATVTNSGTSSAAVFDFEIPQGETGATGPQGPSGVVAASAPITYNAGTQTVGFDTSWNPFDQDLDQADQVNFQSVTVPGLSGAVRGLYLQGIYATNAGATTGVILSETGVNVFGSADLRFPDDSIQTTAYLGGDLKAANNLSDLADDSLARGNLGLGTMATETAADYLDKAGNLAGLANTGTARNNLGLGTMATETAANYALLNGPTFTGDPKAPTPATSDNDTSIATTAFVNAYCPAASTTVAGKVELATVTESIAATSATLALTPEDLYWNRVTPGLGMLPGNVSNGTVSGAGAASNASMFGFTCFGPDPGVVGYGGRRFQMNNGQVGSLQREWGVVDFDQRISVSFRIAYHLVSSGTPSNDSVINVNYGDLLGTDTGGNLARKGFGIQLYGHNNPLRLTVHDGTTYRTVNSSFTPVSSSTVATMDFLLISEAGTVTLYQRTTRTGGWSQIATSANGPTGLSAANASSLIFTARNESVAVTTVRWRFLAGFVSVEY